MADLNYASVHQTAGRTSEPGRHLGQLVDCPTDEQVSVINGYATAYDVWTPTYSSSTTTVTFQAPDESSATTYTLSAAVTSAALLAEALGDLGTALGRAVTEWYTINQTTGVCTAKNAGITGTFTAAGGVTWANSTAGSSGTDLPVGRILIRTGFGTNPGAKGIVKGRLPASSTTQNPVSKQVITFTPSAGIGAGDQMRLVVRSTYLPRATCTIEVNYNASLTATLDDLVTDANTIMDLGIGAGGLGSGAGAVASNSGGTAFVLTADVKGYAFDADLFIVNGASGTMTLTSKAYTTGAPGEITTDIVPSILGPLSRDGQTEDDSSNVPVLKPFKVGVYCRRGGCVVANSQSPTADDVVWLDPATGLCYNAMASGYIPMPKNVLRWDHSGGSSGYEVIRVRQN